MSDERMLARKWVIAARFHDPSDYGIPEAPVLPAVTCDPDTLSLGDPDTQTVVMAATEPMRVRR